MAAHTPRRFGFEGHGETALEQDVKLQSRRKKRAATSPSEPRLCQISCSAPNAIWACLTWSIWKTLVSIERNPHALHPGDPCALYVSEK